MSNLPIDPKLRPTEEQMMRAEIADLLFLCHSDINVAIGHAALDIADCAPIPAALALMEEKVKHALQGAIELAYRKAGLTI